MMKVTDLKQAAMSCLGEVKVKGVILFMLLEEPGEAGFDDRNSQIQGARAGIQLRSEQLCVRMK